MLQLAVIILNSDLKKNLKRIVWDINKSFEGSILKISIPRKEQTEENKKVIKID
jgi:HSP20 family molecular chaperone IbpA